MSITTQVALKDKELEKINYFVNMGYFAYISHLNN